MDWLLWRAFEADSWLGKDTMESLLNSVPTSDSHTSLLLYSMATPLLIILSSRTGEDAVLKVDD